MQDNVDMLRPITTIPTTTTTRVSHLVVHKPREALEVPAAMALSFKAGMATQTATLHILPTTVAVEAVFPSHNNPSVFF